MKPSFGKKTPGSKPCPTRKDPACKGGCKAKGPAGKPKFPFPPKKGK